MYHDAWQYNMAFNHNTHQHKLYDKIHLPNNGKKYQHYIGYSRLLS